MSGARRSRCQTRQDPPLAWHYYRELPGKSPVIPEFKKALEGLPQTVREWRLGEISQRLNAASRGELEIGQELKPLARDPDLWELRWRFSGEHWRLYHGEPAELPLHLLALLFHQKDTSGSEDDVKRAQDRFIHAARHRYVTGRRSRWGLP